MRYGICLPNFTDLASAEAIEAAAEAAEHLGWEAVWTTDHVLPAHGAGLPILVGGRAEAALRRAGRLADGYHSSATGPAALGPRIPVIRAAAEAAGRAMPALSARVRVAFDEPAQSSAARSYAMRGTPDDVAIEMRAFADLGVEHLALFFAADSPEAFVKAAE